MLSSWCPAYSVTYSGLLSAQLEIHEVSLPPSLPLEPRSLSRSLSLTLHPSHETVLFGRFTGN